MKKDGLLSEILNVMVRHERKKAEDRRYDEILDQKKQLWYGIMNQLEPETDDKQAEDDEGKQ